LFDIFYNEGKFKVVEKSSQNVLGIFDSKKDAQDTIQKFKQGGFQGWIPQFFLNPHFGERSEFLRKIQA
jgi:hypothetical protein